MNRLTHTCPINGGRFAPSACDIRLTKQGRDRMLHLNPVLVYSLADCATCSGPVPIGSIPRVEVIKAPAPIPTPEAEEQKTRLCCCRVCGETDPAKFHAYRNTICRVHYNEWQAGKHKVARAMKKAKDPPKFKRQLIYQCQFCGETDPNRFYGSMRATCKKCHNVRVAAKASEARRKAKEISVKARETRRGKS